MEAREPARLNEWQRGPYDKRSSPWPLYFVIIFVAIIWIMFLQTVDDPDDSFAMLTVIAWTLIVILFISSVASTRFIRRTVRIEEVRYFDLYPQRVSMAIERLLRGEGIPHAREGPTGDGKERWEDRFELLGDEYLGHSIAIERNPITRRVDLSCVSVQSSGRKEEPVTRLKELVESAITAERLRDESALEAPPDLVLYAPPP
jgi:hypothetical protein